MAFPAGLEMFGPFAAFLAAVPIGGVVQDVAASGLRYVDVNAQSGCRLQGEGDQVMLLKLELDDAAKEQLWAECTAMQV